MIGWLRCYLGIHRRQPYGRGEGSWGVPVEGWRCSRCGRLRLRAVSSP